MNNNPIGIFDSGVGGLTIWKELNELLPNEQTIYLADSINAPYGQKSKQEIIDLCIKNTELLLSKGCKLIVVACNTATTNAIAYLRANYKIPFIGIEPAIKPAALHTKTNAIGVLATKGTLTSELFHNATELYAENITIVEQIGAGLVELIEDGKLDSPEIKELLKSFIEPMLLKNIDYLVLGCTHYPFLIPQLKDMLLSEVRIIDSGEAVARQTKKILEEEGISASMDKNRVVIHSFYNNKEVEVMEFLLKMQYKVSYLNF